MNKIGLHWGYWRGTELENDWTGIMDALVKADIDVFEIGPQAVLPWSRAQRETFKKALADRGLIINFNGGLTHETDIASDDPAVRRAGIEYSKRVLDVVAQMGGINWSGINYSQWLRHPGRITSSDRQYYFDLSVDAMRKIIGTAEDLGVVYGYEVVTRFDQFIFNTAQEAVAYCQAVDSDNAQLHLDTWHMNVEEDSMADAIACAAYHGRLSHMHVCENNRRVPGLIRGNINWPEIFGALKQAGYRGYLTMEPFVIMGATNSHMLGIWRNLGPTDLDTMIENVRLGAEFLRRGMAQA
ncbi:MAG: sugar phosphate isomerase/epimerase family protein [Christensenellales bacterium]|jgi:D-psicose/D-tagatose/L-ribulose 3-epimerase